MEKKTKHRILGFVVIAAVLVILFPFLEKEKGLPPQTGYIAPPPFPAPASNGVNTQPADTIAPQSTVNQPVVNPSTDQQNNLIPITPAQPMPAKSSEDKNQPGANNPTKDKVTYLPPPTKTQDVPVQATADDVKHNIESELFNIKSQIVSNTHKKISEFTDIKPLTWVVQLGVFKEKTNALRLVNQLRASGYHAFLSKAGELTKVFVGPENKQRAAHLLASRLEQEMHLRGIVVNYKPFTL